MGKINEGIVMECAYRKVCSGYNEGECRRCTRNRILKDCVDFKVVPAYPSEKNYGILRPAGRFVVVDAESGECVDNAQSFGYATEQKAYDSYKRMHDAWTKKAGSADEKAEPMIECIYGTKCARYGTGKCRECANNTKRNFAPGSPNKETKNAADVSETGFFQKANDNEIPERCPRIKYEGPAEQTSGYECPVCGAYTNPYAMRGKRCSGCGYKLNIRR